MRHDEIREAIRLRALGLIEPEQLRRLDALLAEDNDAVELLRAEQQLLEDFAELGEAPPVQIDVRERVLRDIGTTAPRPLRAPRLQLLMAAAAGLIGAVALGAMGWRFRAGWAGLGRAFGQAANVVSEAAWEAAGSVGAHLASGTGPLPVWLPIAFGMAAACYVVLVAAATLVVGRDVRAAMVRLRRRPQ